jgi:hypothetical protein
VKNYATQDDEIIDADGTPLFVSVTTAVRDRLAAQAPRMARLLTENQWCAQDRNENDCCPECGAFQTDGIHKEWCALAAVLRDAGVIE